MMNPFVECFLPSTDTRSWNISAIDAAGQATWPANTYKVYPDFSNHGWAPAVDVDGTLLDDFPVQNATGPIPNSPDDSEMTAIDYYEIGPDIFDDTNYGWPASLEYDEYPLEIRCLSCFLSAIHVHLPSLLD